MQDNHHPVWLVIMLTLASLILMWILAPQAHAQTSSIAADESPATPGPTPPPSPTPAPVPPTAPAATPTAPASVPITPATDPPTAAPAASPAHTPAWYEQLKIEGLVDTYAMGVLSNHPGAPVSLRVFDTQTATIALAYAEVAVQLPTEPVGFRVDLGLGPVASLTGPLTPTFRDVLVPVQQAYASLKLPGASWLTVDIGKFVTTAGLEVIEAHNNWNYSRSLLFGYAIPFTHTGLRATAVVNEHFTAQASVVNGWDVTIDNNFGKTFGLSGSYDSGHGTTASITTYGGPEQPGNDHDWRFLVDGSLGQAVGDHWNLALNGNFAYEMPGTTWWGIAGYARFIASDHLRLAIRAEYFSDSQGTRLGITMPPMVTGGMPTPVSAGVFEGTATVSVPLFDHAELRGEYRIDAASVSAFADGSRMQQTLTAAALAWF